MNSSASEVSKFGPAMRSQLFNAYLVQRIALGLPFDNSMAVSSAVEYSSSSATQSETRPILSASSPLIGLLVSLVLWNQL